ncbi:MAG TPA: hypothetical protein VD768_08845 [Sphingomicrobium sp.]|nr:hypothetical protein [Sphingomicrobium sp.]
MERHFCGGTCAVFSDGEISGILTSFSDPGVYRIVHGASAWFFEWSDRFGALRVGPRGETRKQPGWKSPFWTITAIWAKQGKRVRQVGRHAIALWDQPPVITHYWVRQGRKRVIVRSDEPEGSNDYSEERFVECDVAGASPA